MTTGLEPRLALIWERISKTLPAELRDKSWTERLYHDVARTANTERVLLNLDQFLRVLPQPESFWLSLAARPRQAQVLLSLFAGSQHLSQVLIRHPEYWKRLEDIDQLAQYTSSQQYEEQLFQLLANVEDEKEFHLRLCQWQGWEMLRIGVCDLAGILDLTTVTTQLSNLADNVIRVCLRRFLPEPSRGFVILALGKLGGQELNYSSDIDLVCLAEHESVQVFRAAERTIGMLSAVSSEGFLYRVDMRLRPWGQMGSLVPTVAGYVKYLEQNARLWEKQALLKARPVAGDLAMGHNFLSLAAPHLMHCDREVVRAGVREMKQKIEDDLAQHGQAWGEVKLGRGSIRDVEFVTQYLQLIHCGQHPAVLGGNTLNVLNRLRDEGLLTSRDHRILCEGYSFLRPIEHYLQLMDYRQIHALPQQTIEIDNLARRLGFTGGQAGERLLARYQAHSEAIRSVYEQQLFGREENQASRQRLLEPQVRQHLERLSPEYLDTFTPAEIRHHAELTSRLSADNLVEVEATSRSGNQHQVTIVGYDYPGELSLICGLLTALGFSIVDGNIFTYEPAESFPESSDYDARRKIVDVLNVIQLRNLGDGSIWQRYHDELEALLREFDEGRVLEAQTELAKRIAVALPATLDTVPHLQPIEVQLDNTSSERYTILHIEAADTVGFLYELTNALALLGFHISLVTVDSTGARAHDILYLTDAANRKIVSAARQQELKTAVILVKHFTHLLPRSPNPESALLHFRELVGELMRRPNWTHDLASLERPEVLTALARLLGVSDFLWDDFLRLQYDSLFPVLSDISELRQAKTKSELEAELQAALAAAPDIDTKRQALNAFKDREMFRIDLRHIQELVPDFAHFAYELTDLADTVIGAAIHLCMEQTAEQYGWPLDAQGERVPWCLCALGKCGGRELGYASDIELLFLYSASPGMAGGISANEFYHKTVIELLNTIHSKHEGIFTIDLQLRPYGSAGSIAVSLESFQRYYAPDGPAWPYERQALIKLRPITGDSELMQRLVMERDRLVYRPESLNVQAVRAMRERQVRSLVTGGTLNLKFSPGGTVDTEYLVQLLQIRYGQTNPALRLTNTLEAMAALHQAGILTADQLRQLRDAYILLRRTVDSLRMVRGNTRDLTVPAGRK